MRNILTILLLSINLCFAQKPNTTIDVEITEENIVEHPYLKSDKITVFGLKLGMTRETVFKIIEANKNLEYNIDYTHMTKDFRVYVSDKNNPSDDEQILYLIWVNNAKELDNIVFYKNFEKFLVGNTKTFFTLDFQDPNSNLYKYYLGKADEKLVTLDIPSINLKNTSYYYDLKGLSFIETLSGTTKSVSFSFYK